MIENFFEADRRAPGRQQIDDRVEVRGASGAWRRMSHFVEIGGAVQIGSIGSIREEGMVAHLDATGFSDLEHRAWHSLAHGDLSDMSGAL